MSTQSPAVTSQDPRLASIEENVRVNRDALDQYDAISIPNDWRKPFVRMKRFTLGPRDVLLQTLAHTLQSLHDYTGRMDALEESIALFEETLQLRPVGHRERHGTLVYLSRALLRLCRTESYASTRISRCITLHREALQLCPPGHPNRHVALNKLAYVLHMAYVSAGDSDALAEAIIVFRQALLLRGTGHPTRDAVLHSLGCALRSNYDRVQKVTHLEEAIILLHEATRLRPPGHPLRLNTLRILGLCLYQDSKRTNDGHRWTETVRTFREALRISPEGDPGRAWLLSHTGKCLLFVTSPMFDFLQGMKYISDALAYEFSPVRDRLAYATIELSYVEDTYTDAMGLLDTRARHECSLVLLAAYAQAIRLLPRVANFGLRHDVRLRVLAGSEDLSRHAAARSILLDRLPDALEMLEEGRSVFWAQALRMRATALDEIGDNDRTALEAMFRSLEEGGQSELESPEQSIVQRERELESRRQQNLKAEALIVDIRARPGLERFLMPAAYDTLMQVLPAGYVMILITSKLGYHALLLNGITQSAKSLTLNAPKGGLLPDKVLAAIPRGLERVSEPEERSSEDLRAQRAFNVSKKAAFTLDTVLGNLWNSIVWPIIDALSLERTTGHARPRVWWCLTGHLTVLPIHAAGTYRGGVNVQAASDFMVSSYIPTLSALTTARKCWKAILREHLDGLIVADPAPGRGWDRIDNVIKEADVVQGCFTTAGAPVVRTVDASATVSSVVSDLRTSGIRILHMACHGTQRPNPLQSAFILRDEDLTIQDLMRLDLSYATLAFLSACQTAQGDAELPDQVVHLAASLLFCGFRSVIGTLWLMNDEDGPIVAQHVYEAIFKNEKLDLDDIPYALEDAVDALRRTGVSASRWALFVHVGG